MAFLRVYPSRDTSVSNYDPPACGNKDTSQSNIGASEILNLYRTVDLAATSTVLIGFDSLTPPVSGASAFLKLFDAQHGHTLPYGYTAWVRPLEQDWVEGNGLDADFYTDFGVANEVSATWNEVWVPHTGILGASFFFENGHEDLEVEISGLTGTSAADFGFSVSIEQALTGTDLYIKMFHSRQTHFPTKRPFVEWRWNDATGSYTTIPVLIVASGTYSGSIVSSSMFTSATLARLLASGSVVTGTIPAVDVDPTGALVSQISNLRNVYDQAEVVVLNLYTQRKDWNPATVATASADAPSVVLTNAYYSISDVVTGEVFVPFGTGTIPYTKLNYNDGGNFFTLRMSSLPENQLMQLDFIYEAPSGSGNWTVIPGTANRFRVISNG